MDAADHEILVERAERLAQVELQEPAAGEMTSVLVVALGGERYALPLEQVAEIEPLGLLAPVPATPPVWLGIVNLRGRMSPVLYLAGVLGLAGDAAATLHRASAQVVVVRAGNAEIGMLVDGVSEIRGLRLSELSPPLPETDAQGPQCCVGITPDLVCLLDPSRVLTAAGLSSD